MGNICRSPTAEGVFRDLVESRGLGADITVDSAGTLDYHTGDPPDARAQAAARKRGIDIGRQRARQATADDFSRFDYVLVMDRTNRRALAGLCPPGEEHRLHLFTDFCRDGGGGDVPDPYYGGPGGFERVLDMIEEGSRGLLDHIRANHL
jgi:protein-tyrosine phosphatase